MLRAATAVVTALVMMPWGCVWPEDNPFDPLRCSPACGAGQRCLDGQCVTASDLLTGEGWRDAGGDLPPPSAWAWAVPISDSLGDSFVRGDRVAVGPGGDLYVAGYADGAVLSLGGKTLGSAVRSRKFFVARLDGGGKARWISGASGAFGSVSGLAVSSAGDVFWSARFENGTLAVGGKKLVSGSRWDSAVIRLDPQGAVKWAKHLHGTGGSNPTDSVTALVLDEGGSEQRLYIGGYFHSASLTLGSTSLTNAGAPDSDLFVARLDAGGAYRWAVRAGGSLNDHVQALALEPGGTLRAAGDSQSSPLPVGAKSYPKPGAGSGEDILLLRLDDKGTFKAVERAGGNGTDRLLALATAPSGALYAAGVFTSKDLKLAGAVLASAGSYDVLVTRLASGGGFAWARSAGGKGEDWSDALAADSHGVTLGGYHSSSPALFGAKPIWTRGSDDIFIQTFDPQGGSIDLLDTGGGAADRCRHLTQTGQGLAVTGYFISSSLTFGASTLTNSAKATGYLALIK